VVHFNFKTFLVVKFRLTLISHYTGIYYWLVYQNVSHSTFFDTANPLKSIKNFFNTYNFLVNKKLLFFPLPDLVKYPRGKWVRVPALKSPFFRVHPQNGKRNYFKLPRMISSQKYFWILVSSLKSWLTGFKFCSVQNGFLGFGELNCPLNIKTFLHTKKKKRIAR